MTAIVVLGAAVWPDGPSPTLRRRTAHAAKMWHAGRAPIIVVCGGMGKNAPTESAAMHQILRDLRVPDSAIVQEDRSQTTYENIRNAAEMITQRDIIIVTDRYHSLRARMVARHFGLTATSSCPAPAGAHVKQYLREAIALPLYALWLARQRS